MKTRHLTVLKHIALMGGTRTTVPLSTRELGEILELSQQSASKYLLELLEDGLVTRRLGARKQLVRVSEKGVEVLRREYTDYQRIFEDHARLTVEGVVTTGLGEGQYYVTQKGYNRQFEAKLDFEPYKGTLNLKVKDGDVSKVRVLRNSPGIPIEGFRTGTRTFGAVKCFTARIGDVECAVVLPKRSHYSDTIEVISEHYLRGELKLKDGDVVELVIET